MNIEKGQPLTLPDGTIITNAGDGNETTITTKEEIEEDDNLRDIAATAFNEEGNRFQRTLADITVPFEEMNPTMLVLAYSMWGLDEHAIGRVLGKTGKDIHDFQLTNLYIETRDQLVESLRYAETNSIHGYLAQQSGKAVSEVVRAMNQNRDGDRSLRAAQDLLDRGGFRPADRVEHIHKFEDDLKIVYIKKDERNPIVIDIDL